MSKYIEEGKQFEKELDAIHDDKPCAADIENEWCEKCFHLKPKLISWMRTVPWYVMLYVKVSVFIDWFVGNLKLLLTYPSRRGRNEQPVYKDTRNADSAE